MEKGMQNNMNIEPEDISRVFQNSLHVVQGHHDVLPDLLNDTGHLLMKASKKLTTTQLILIVAGVAIASIFVAKKMDVDLDMDM